MPPDPRERRERAEHDEHDEDRDILMDPGEEAVESRREDEETREPDTVSERDELRESGFGA